MKKPAKRKRVNMVAYAVLYRGGAVMSFDLCKATSTYNAKYFGGFGGPLEVVRVKVVEIAKGRAK